MNALSSATTLLFVPGDRPERFAKAIAAGADRVIIDLEDAVAMTRKAQAREALVTWATDWAWATDGAWAAAGRDVMVRINAAGTQNFAEDVAACRSPGITAIMVPKAEDRHMLEALHGLIGKPLIALVESARGLRAVDDLARASGVERLAFGSLDLALDLGISDPDAALDRFRLDLVVASRLAGLAAPIDGVLADFRDPDRLAADTGRVKALGFTAKLCIHPAQVATVRLGLMVSAAEIEWANRILASADGAAAVDGVMVDRPLRERAARILSRAQAAQRG